MSSAAQREALTNALTGGGALAMSAWSSEKLEGLGERRPGVAAARREEKRRRTYNARGGGGGRGTQPGAERERYSPCYCGCAAFLGRGQALVGL